VACQTSAGFFSLIRDGTTVPVTAMLSVRDTAVAAGKNLLNMNSAAAQCHSSYRTLCCSYMTKWRTSDPERETSGVVTSLTGNTSQNTHSKNRTHIASVLQQCNLRCLNGSSNVQITKHAGSVSCSECLPLVTDIIFTHNMFSSWFGLNN